MWCFKLRFKVAVIGLVGVAIEVLVGVVVGVAF